MENYGFLRLTPEGRQFIRSPKPFTVVLDRQFDEAEDSAYGNVTALDDKLYKLLKNLRKDVARKHNLPPYVVFQDISITLMATNYPITMDELLQIQGVGQGKAKKFGAEFIELIKRYCVENDIQRTDMMRVISLPNKSQKKLKIIELIDKRVPLDEIAKSQGCTFDELLDDIESIVNGGMKVDIGYYIDNDEVVDSDEVADIYEYFRTSETDDIDEAIEEADVYDDEDGLTAEQKTRLVLIKFMSEEGN